MSSPIATRRAVQKAKIQTRAMVKSVDAHKPNKALLEAKRKAKLLKMQENNKSEVAVRDIYQHAIEAINVVRGETGIVFDESMHEHRCLWDKNHPERPERFTRVLQRCTDLGLVNRCKRIPSRKATKEEVMLKHSEEHYKKLEATSEVTDELHLEGFASNYDSIYFHPTTFGLSLLSVGSTINLVESIVRGQVQNGMAIIRPPGHHAMKSEFNGYCYFNNVAIAAEYALNELKLKKIMIIDWDIHHGQGTQRLFYDDNRVLYFSIHRFEQGTFWPNLKESDWDYIGEGAGKGFNFNLPLNAIGMTNADYLAVFQQILVPVAVEYQPELIIVSAGYDAALGCPEGEMEITPAFYPHLLNTILPLAQSKIAVILEGGYCLESLAEGAALTLRTLLGDPCPVLVEELTPPCQSIQESILNCIYSHRPFWKCLSMQATYTVEELNNTNPQPDLHKVVHIFKGGPPLPEKFPTRNCYPIQDSNVIAKLETRLASLKLNTKLSFPKMRVCYVYDDLMMEHRNLFEDGHPEQPARIKKIFDKHAEYGLFERMEKLQSRHATTDEICLAHTRAHINSIRRIVSKAEITDTTAEKFNSIYFHPKTFDCATLAAGSVLQVVDAVLTGKARSGVCIVRPPGHHAEPNVPHGFCIFNNVAIAAKYAIRDHHLKRVLIIDWDVHHGNGTQHIFDNNSNVLYISVHRYDNATFFPKSKDANFDQVGRGPGEGFNVNIPWNKKGMGDMEYVMAMQQIILPIAYEFDPELVLVSAGFDAAIGDPLGGCKVSPEAYGVFTHWISALANGRVILCLEGGYNVNSISYAMTMCSKALLGDPMPVMSVSQTKTAAFSSCVETIQEVLTVQQKYWKSLVFNKKLPEIDFGLTMEIDSMEAKFKDMQLELEGAVGGSDEPANAKTLTEFLETLKHDENEMFAIVPLKTCPHLVELPTERDLTRIDTKSECIECHSTIENWMCLHCEKVLCGRYINEHMLFHYLGTNHPLALSFSDLSVWCYPCEAYVDNPLLYKYKNLAHRDKFGEEMVWSYDNEFVLH